MHTIETGTGSRRHAVAASYRVQVIKILRWLSNCKSDFLNIYAIWSLSGSYHWKYASIGVEPIARCCKPMNESWIDPSSANPTVFEYQGPTFVHVVWKLKMHRTTYNSAQYCRWIEEAPATLVSALVAVRNVVHQYLGKFCASRWIQAATSQWVCDCIQWFCCCEHVHPFCTARVA